MFKIGEFSKLTQVSIRMLRYYDETGLLKPARIDKFTGYRLYSIEQLPILNKIIFLRDLDFSVAEIANVLNHWEDTFIEEQLKSKQLEIEDAIRTFQSKSSKIDLAIKDINQENISIHYNVAIKRIPSYQVISLRKIIPNYFAEGQLWGELSDFVEKNKVGVSHQSFAIYYDQGYKDHDVEVEVCACVEKMGECTSGFTYRETEPIQTMACTMVSGPFGNIAGAYLSFANWLQEHNQYKMNGQNRQVVHRGPWNEDSSDKYLTEIQIPLEMK